MPRFLHLSDIHFSKDNDGTEFDLDLLIRGQVEAEVEENVHRQGPINVILVTGDVAFSGQEHEYKLASEWLTKISDIAQTRPEDVLVVPGNHDADRGIVRKNDMISDAHQTIRAAHRTERDRKISSYFGEPKNADIMLSPLLEYSKFAHKYGCDLKARHLIWRKQYQLAERISLRLHGLNSAIISDEWDDTARVVLGASQLNFAPKKGTVEMTLCHHPPNDLLDGDEVERGLSSRVHIQLFGHRHNAVGRVVADRLRIHAGAAQPSRNEPEWEPAFAFFSVEIAAIDEKEVELTVTIEPRKWSRNQEKFIRDEETLVTDFTARIERPRVEPTRVVASTALPAPLPTPSSIAPQAPAVASELEERLSDPARRLAFRFLSLPYLERQEIATRLQLTENADEDLREPELSSAFLQRARIKGCLSALWQELNNASNTHEDNPFKEET